MYDKIKNTAQYHFTNSQTADSVNKLKCYYNLLMSQQRWLISYSGNKYYILSFLIFSSICIDFYLQIIEYKTNETFYHFVKLVFNIIIAIISLVHYSNITCTRTSKKLVKSLSLGGAVCARCKSHVIERILHSLSFNINFIKLILHVISLPKAHVITLHKLVS